MELCTGQHFIFLSEHLKKILHVWMFDKLNSVCSDKI
jgi:hypothetical protein